MDLVTAEERVKVLERIRAINAYAAVIETEYAAAPIDEARARRVPASPVLVPPEAGRLQAAPAVATAG